VNVYSRSLSDEGERTVARCEGVVAVLGRLLGRGALGGDAHAGLLEDGVERGVVGPADDSRPGLSVVAPDLGGVELALHAVHAVFLLVVLEDVADVEGVGTEHVDDRHVASCR
jgi:hypothetical protein